MHEGTPPWAFQAGSPANVYEPQTTSQLMARTRVNELRKISNLEKVGTAGGNGVCGQAFVNS